ncbi:hypothetical protein [Burkholderia ubonensis]|uniref:hypothetical protein n=1 Tax=Burkholderia ubonensis TaxID=101571 RepID=UPI000B09E7DE|nr:hypothetical protein [Burkholderia ubonensis]
MNSDDSSRLPLAGEAMRTARPIAHRAPASDPLITDQQPIAPGATRRGAFVRR